MALISTIFGLLECSTGIKVV